MPGKKTAANVADELKSIGLVLCCYQDTRSSYWSLSVSIIQLFHLNRPNDFRNFQCFVQYSKMLPNPKQTQLTPIMLSTNLWSLLISIFFLFHINIMLDARRLFICLCFCFRRRIINNLWFCYFHSCFDFHVVLLSTKWIKHNINTIPKKQKKIINTQT